MSHEGWRKLSDMSCTARLKRIYAECKNEFPCSEFPKQANSTVRTYDGSLLPHMAGLAEEYMFAECRIMTYIHHLVYEMLTEAGRTYEIYI